MDSRVPIRKEGSRALIAVKARQMPQKGRILLPTISSVTVKNMERPAEDAAAADKFPPIAYSPPIKGITAAVRALRFAKKSVTAVIFSYPTRNRAKRTIRVEQKRVD